MANACTNHLSNNNKITFNFFLAPPCAGHFFLYNIRMNDRASSELSAVLTSCTQQNAAHHCKDAHASGGYDVETIVNYTLLAVSVLTAAVVIAPLALPAMGIGAEVEKELLDSCCNVIPDHSGITESITQTIEKIPVVGTYLNLANPETSMAAKALVPAAAILGSHAAGSLVQDYEKRNEGSGAIGTGIKLTGMGIGVILSLPVLLPGIAHGVMFLGETTGAKNIGKLIARDIGTNFCAVKGPNPVEGATVTSAYSSVMGAGVSAGVLAGHVGCLAPALLSLGGAGASNAQKILAKRAENAAQTRTPT